MFVKTDRDKTSILYREPSIDASYQVAVHLAKRFQRRRSLKVGQSETRIVSKDCTFCPDPLKTWPPQAILVSDWPTFKDLLL
jgi:hypothetical protein